MSEATPVVLGWREWVALPGLGVDAVRAKVDSGARSSSLHVDTLESFERDGREWVRFSLHPGERGSGTVCACEAPVLERRPVTDSGGHTTLRVFVHTDIVLAGSRYTIEINLTNRRGMLFPMLLGRTALADRFVIDPAASFLLGEPVHA